MNKTNDLIFKALLVISWLIFVGLCIEAGGYLVNFFFSVFKPQALPNLYQKIDLTGLYSKSSMLFISVYGFILTTSILKAVLFYQVIRLMHYMDLTKPFNTFVAKQISLMSYYTLSIGAVGFIALQYLRNISKLYNLNYGLNEIWDDSKAFILMGAVIYIIANIFKKGVEIQNENDLTV